jgi:hypothetical protein
MIYFVQAGDDSRPIKIGYARNVGKRIATMQTGCPDELNLLAVMDGDEDVERSLHGLMGHLRVRGEWFRPAPELLDQIKSVSDNDSAASCRSLMALIRSRRSPYVRIGATPEQFWHWVELRERVAVKRALSCRP